MGGCIDEDAERDGLAVRGALVGYGLADLQTTKIERRADADRAQVRRGQLELSAGLVDGYDGRHPQAGDAFGSTHVTRCQIASGSKLTSMAGINNISILLKHQVVMACRQWPSGVLGRRLPKLPIVHGSHDGGLAFRDRRFFTGVAWHR